MSNKYMYQPRGGSQGSSIDPTKKKHLKGNIKQQLPQDNVDNDSDQDNQQNYYQDPKQKQQISGIGGGQKPPANLKQKIYYEEDQLKSIDQEESKSSRVRYNKGYKKSNPHSRQQSLSEEDEYENKQKQKVPKNPQYQQQNKKDLHLPINNIVPQVQQQQQQQQLDSSDASSGQGIDLNEDYINNLFGNTPQSDQDADQQDDDDEESSKEDFYDQAQQESDFDDLESDIRPSARGGQSNRRVIPLEFARQHIQKIEEDMKRMHERHVKLMREMDDNYRLIEQETQEYYIEFLQKWKELAKNKISRYKDQCDQLVAEKIQIVKQKDQQIDNLNEKITQILNEKQRIVQDYNQDIELRDKEKETNKIYYQEQIKKLEKDKANLQQKLDSQNLRIRSLEQELDETKGELKISKDDYFQKINDYEDSLQQKIQENGQLNDKINELKNTITQLEIQVQSQFQSSGNSNSTNNQNNGIFNKGIKLNIKKINPSVISRQSLNRPQIQNLDSQNDSMQRPNIQLFKKIKIDNFNSQAPLVVGQTQPNSTTNEIQQKNLINDQHMQQQQPSSVYSNLAQMKRDYNNKNNEEEKSNEQAKNHIESVEVEYNQKIVKKEQEIKSLHSQLLQYQNEEKQKTGQEKVSISKQSPMYPLLQKYKALQEEVKQLKEQKKQEIDKLKLASNQQTKMDSARGSRSLSPRQYNLRKNQMIQQQQNQTVINSNQTQIASSSVQDTFMTNDQLQKLTEERDKLKQEIEMFINTNKIIEETKSLVNSKLLFDSETRSELQKLKQMIGQQIGSQELKSQMEKQNSDIEKIKEMYNQVAQKLKQSMKIISQYQQELQSLKKQSLQHIPESNNESAIYNSEINQSNVTNMQQIDISVIEDRLKKKLEQEYNNSIIKLEQEAKEQFTQKMRQERKEKEQLKYDMQNKSKEVNQIKSQYEQILKEHRMLKEETKNGELLLVNQVKQLQEEKDKLASRVSNEIMIRKKLHNQIEDMKGKIRVYCRVRPLSQQEIDQKAQSIVRVTDDFTLKFKVKNEAKIGQGQQGSHEQEFSFDTCYGSYARQEDIFEDTKMLIQSAIDGYNVCIFAYGQTGSGKTYTMQGSTSNPGIVPRAIQEIFSLKEKNESNGHYSIELECYMVQLYIDQLQDCLTSEKNLQSQQRQRLEIREDPSTGMILIENTTKYSLNSLREATDVFERGIKSRKVFGTSMNQESSRSHLIFTIIVNTLNTETRQRTKSKISFVDLAGSERYDKQNATPERVAEGIKINKSLSELSNVIQKLSSGEASTHIPYRNNKLTHLMKDSIGGNSKTLMFVNISPADCNSQETKLSLYFGSKIKEIQNPIQKNIESDEIRKLREEINFLKTQLPQVNTQQTKWTNAGMRDTHQ